MTQKKLTFKLVYLIFLAVLAALVLSATMYVRSLLTDYEASQPQRQVEAVIDELLAAAEDGSFLTKYPLPEAAAGRFEAGMDLHSAYLALYEADALSCVEKGGLHGEDELYYYIENDGFPLAEVKLKAAGPAVSKLVVFSLRDWQVESVTPVFESHDYTLSLPAEFAVSVNGIPLAEEDCTISGGKAKYTLQGLYLKPDVKITDNEGNYAAYTVKNGRILAEYYDYDLTLPATLTVSLNGTVHEGTDAGGDRVHYDITLLTKPDMKILDLFGNEIAYDGGSELPLTYASITVDEGYTVQVDGAAVPAKAVATVPNPNYAHFADYVDGLSGISVYNIAILKADAVITVTDPNGKAVALEEGVTVHNLTADPVGLDAVPAEIAAQVDVLDVAKKWSLFMSADLAFSKLSPSLISGSYQYQVAKKYATGIDITFISNHILRDPAFTGESVSNFVWITEDCFSVDISFTKHMYLTRTGENVDDTLNDRFYFVRCDDTDNGRDDPVWKLATMKEIIDNARV
ncbi:MAG: hypothetical protein E7429_07365 [Ruminococcaceae bacterium]|nr:hypothetical protein [Oscillospiraceae bacterium]MBE6996521.1 hypothetical protein [Oscillospiraceae bacterium]